MKAIWLGVGTNSQFTICSQGDSRIKAFAFWALSDLEHTRWPNLVRRSSLGVEVLSVQTSVTTSLRKRSLIEPIDYGVLCVPDRPTLSYDFVRFRLGLFRPTDPPREARRVEICEAQENVKRR